MGSPREGWIKVNVDGAFSTNGSGGVGVIMIIWVVSFCPLGEPFSMLHRRKKSKHWLAWKVYG
jgi:hypothetical protein